MWTKFWILMFTYFKYKMAYALIYLRMTQSPGWFWESLSRWIEKIKGKITKSESRLFSSVPLLRREIASSWPDDVFLSLQNMALLISTLFLLTASEWVFFFFFFFNAAVGLNSNFLLTKFLLIDAADSGNVTVWERFLTTCLGVSKTEDYLPPEKSVWRSRSNS